MIKRTITIDINSITGNNFQVPILLTQKSENIGLLEDLSDITDIESVFVTVTGVTDNKLQEVRGFDYNNPFTVGSNGITEVTDSYIAYTIGNVNYKTILNDLSTIFSFTDTRNVYLTNNFISEDSYLNYVDNVQITDEVFIERQNISIIESFSRLRQITSVEEIANYGNGFYQINNQTI